MRVLATIVLLALLGLAGALGAAWLGLPDVAATTPHWSATEWLLATTMEHSVRRRARGIAAPDDLDAPVRIWSGAAAYADMCSGCHGAPGVEVGVIGQGLTPEPPELSEEVAEWSAAELFWITKHGVRMTGMPAFGPSHSDREIWDIVAFIRQLPEMSAAEYASLTAKPPEEHPTHEHSHGPSH